MIRFAINIVLLAESEEDLKATMDDVMGTVHNLRINRSKTKVVVCDKGGNARHKLM